MLFAGGEAFEQVRRALNELKAKPSKTGVLTSFVLARQISAEKLVERPPMPKQRRYP
jgi:acyl-CoA-binding protein